MADVKFNARTLKEIAAAKKIAENGKFQFILDDKGELGDINCCYLKWKVQDGIYKDQEHILRFKFVYGQKPDIYEYPRNAPNVTFLTPILHTNISTQGSICLDVIKSDNWSPMYGIETILNSIIALLDEPNTKSPFNSSAATAYRPLEKLEKTDPKYEETFKAYQKKCQDYYDRSISNSTLLINSFAVNESSTNL